MRQIPAAPPPFLPLLLFALLLVTIQPVLSGPAISGFSPTTADAVVGDQQQKGGGGVSERRHAFAVLEPELAERIFNRDGVAKNPLRRTTTMPLTDRLDVGHNGGSAAAIAGGGTGAEPKLAATVNRPRAPRSIARQPSEYDALNEDFVSEYDALNLDFSLDEAAAGAAAKGLQVPSREFSWQEEEEGQKVEQFPPKEWWGDDGEGEEAKVPEKVPAKVVVPERRSPPALMASKLFAGQPIPMVEERRRELPPQSEDEGATTMVDLPKDVGGKRRSGRARRGARVEGVARLDGWPVQRGFGTVDREELKIVPRLVPSWPPPTSSIPPRTTTQKGQKEAEEESTESGVGGHAGVPPKKQQRDRQQPANEDLFRDLPSGLDEASSSSDGAKQSFKLPPLQRPSPQFGPQPSQRPFPADQQQPFQPVLNLGSSPTSGQQTGKFAAQPPPPQNHGQATPAGRLLPTGFVHIATLEAPPQRLGPNQILIDGKRFWVERTVPFSQFHGGQQKRPAEELPALLEMPQLEGGGGEQMPPMPEEENGPEDAKVPENAEPAEDAKVPEEAKVPENGTPPHPEENGEGGNRPSAPSRRNRPTAPRGRVANSARVFSLADNDTPLWTGGGGGGGQFRPSPGAKRLVASNSKSGSLLALNLGTALSQIFGNFTIEHDARPVERKPAPAELLEQPAHFIQQGGGRGGEAASEPHRLTRFFDPPQRHLHGN